MTPELWHRISALYAELADLPAPERQARLASLAGAEPELHRELARLFSVPSLEGGALLDRPPLGSVLAPFLAGAEGGPRLQPGDVLADGRFEIIEQRGEGGMGEVYEAEDRELHARIAIKVIRSQVADHTASLARFRREIALARQVTHRSVCRVHDFFPGVPTGRGHRVDILTMELLDGETLAQLLGREAPVTLARALPLLRQIAGGLDAAHAAGVLHRDLKGSNIFLTSDADGPRVVITDFGLARSASGSDGFTTASAAGAGTPLFMSPEQMEGAEVGPASDIYSLGVLMYQMATGVVPMQDLSPLQIAAKRAKELPSSPRHVNREIDPAWEAAILRCLAIDPARRFASGAAMIATLERRSSSRIPFVGPASEAASGFLSGRLVLGAAIALAAVAGGWWTRDRWKPLPALSPEVARFYQEGVAAVSDGSPAKAMRSLERALELNPALLSARCRLAEAFMELDMRDRAQEQLLAAVDRQPRDEAERLLCDGVRAALAGDWPRAIASAQSRATIASPTPADRIAARQDLGRWLDRAGKPAEAAEEFQRITKADASQPGVLLRLADIRARQGKNPESAALLDKAEATYRAFGNGEALGEVALVRSRVAPSLPEAARLAEEAVARAKEASSDWLRVRAIRRHAQVVRDQGDAPAYRRLALEAITVAEQAGLPGQAADALVDLGFASFSQGKFEAAEPDYRRALQLAGRFRARTAEARARLALAQWSIEQQQFAQAGPLLDQALGFYRESGNAVQIAQTLRYRGDLMQFQARFDEARRAFTEALDASPSPATRLAARSRLAFLARQQLRYNEAADGFRTVSAEFEQMGDRVQGQAYRIELVRMLIMTGQLAGAAAELEKARLAGVKDEALARRLTAVEAELDFQQLRFAPALARMEALRAEAGRAGRLTEERGYRYQLCGFLAEAGQPARSVELCQPLFKEFAGRAAQLAAVRESMAINYLARREPARAAEEARQAVAYHRGNREPRNIWYNLMLVAQALHQAKDPAWPQARDEARTALEALRREIGEDAARTYLSRPLIARRLQTLERLQ